VACVIGDGEAETGPLAGSWHANKGRAWTVVTLLSLI